MKGLSVRAPWWWFILHGGKDIENRDKSSPCSPHFRGTVALHASKWWKLDEIKQDAEDAAEIARLSDIYRGQEITWVQMAGCGGCIVGTVDIVDCVTESDSPWFFGHYGFVLRNPVAFPTPIPFKGSLGFFDVPFVCLPISPGCAE